MVLNSTYEQEDLKRLIVSTNRQFYLVKSKDPFATYKVLWYRVSSRKSCKVDILIPGIMNIPQISMGRIEYSTGRLPLMPFSLNLLMKLQGWEDHRYASKSHLNRKQHMDVQDLRYMLLIAVRRKTKPLSETWIPADFLVAAERRVKDYVNIYRDSKPYWERLGFETETETENAFYINTPFL